MSHRAIKAAALCAAIVSTLTISAPADAGQRLETIRARGALNCGLPAGGVPGFNIADAQGVWRGFNVDFCRAVAIAIFGSPDRVRFSPLTPVNRFTALQTGTVDILSSNVTATFSPQPTYNLAVNIAGAGSGTVVSTSPMSPTINCGVVCAAQFPAGTVVTLSASPAAGSKSRAMSGSSARSARVCCSSSTARSRQRSRWPARSASGSSSTRAAGSSSGVGRAVRRRSGGRRQRLCPSRRPSLAFQSCSRIR